MSANDHPARNMVELLRSLCKQEALEKDGFVCLTEEDLTAMDRQMVKLIQEMSIIDKHYGLIKTSVETHIVKTQEKMDKIEDYIQLTDRHLTRVETLVHSINSDVNTLEMKLADLAKRLDESLR